MTALITILLIILAASVIMSVIDFLVYVNKGQRPLKRPVLMIVEIIALIASPIFFLSTFDSAKENNCCGDIAFFSPGHRITIYLLILLCIVAYGYSSFRRGLAPPLIELAINCFIVIGIILNIIIAIQIGEIFIWCLGNISIIALFLSQLYRNQQLILTEITPWGNQKNNSLAKVSIKILKAKFFVKYPMLLGICLPLLLLLSVLLLVFGQKPDSAIRAFTDTYKQGLSQLDYMCDNVKCGEHYLCSVAANGHTSIVKPERYGERNGGKIICNRQLLVANAFEELMEQRFPSVHSVIRKKYNKLGNTVHRYYSVFNNKLFSDIIYFLMKPLEYFFLFVLYLFDKKPEDRIAMQYLSQADKEKVQLQS